MGNKKREYDAEDSTGSHSSIDGDLTFKADSPEDARQQADQLLDDNLGDTTPGAVDVVAVTDIESGEETRFD